MGWGWRLAGLVGMANNDRRSRETRTVRGDGRPYGIDRTRSRATPVVDDLQFRLDKAKVFDQSTNTPGLKMCMLLLSGGILVVIDHSLCRLQQFGRFGFHVFGHLPNDPAYLAVCRKAIEISRTISGNRRRSEDGRPAQ